MDEHEGLPTVICRMRVLRRITDETRDVKEEREQLAYKTLLVGRCRINNSAYHGDQELLALDILPEEMWRKVLESVDTIQDRWNCFKTCELFQSIICKRPAQLLFPVIIPELFKTLSKADILRCRLVCKDWEASTNDFLEKFMLQNIHLTGDKNFTKMFWIRPDKQRQETQDKMQQHKRNPFVGKAVKLTAYGGSDFSWPIGSVEEQPARVIEIEENYPMAHNLIEKIGENVQTLELGGFQNHIKGPAAVKLLRDALELCPNLKKLSLYPFLSDGEMKTSREQFENGLPYPKLKQLAYFYSGFDQGRIIKKILTSYSAQLRYAWIYCWLDEFSEFNWGCLELLHLHGDCLPNPETFSAPNLKTLHVAIRCNLDVFDIYKIVKSFPQLKELCVTFPRARHYDFPQDHWKKLFKETKIIILSLETLQLEYNDNFTSYPLDFLVLFPRLKILKLLHYRRRSGFTGLPNRVYRTRSPGSGSKDNYFDPVYEWEDFEFGENGNGDCLRALSLWELLPCLKEIIVFGDSISHQRFTRYDYYRRRNSN